MQKPMLQLSELARCTCLRADSPTVVVLLHHDWNQTTLSGRVHLSSVHRHCVGVCTLQGAKEIGSEAELEAGELGRDRLRTYHDHVHALLDRVSPLALDGGDAFVDAVDAPRVALCCLRRPHGTPFDGSGRGGGGLFWKARSLR